MERFRVTKSKTGNKDTDVFIGTLAQCASFMDVLYDNFKSAEPFGAKVGKYVSNKFSIERGDVKTTFAIEEI